MGKRFIIPAIVMIAAMARSQSAPPAPAFQPENPEEIRKALIGREMFPAEGTLEIQNVVQVHPGQCEVRLSGRRADGGYLFRNVLYTIQLDENQKITKLQRLSPPAPQSGFWSGVFESDQIGILVKEDGEEPRIDHVLPGTPVAQPISLPSWLTMYTRQSGRYAVPLRNGKVCGSSYQPLPLGAHHDLSALAALFDYYRTITPSGEMDFLYQYAITHPNWRETALRRLAETGVFRHPFTENQTDWFRALVRNPGLTVPEKRFLIESFPAGNFHRMKPFYEASLEDENTAALAGRIWFDTDRNGFEDYMLECLNDEKRWKAAIRQGELLTENRACLLRIVEIAATHSLAWGLEHFIPALCVYHRQTGSPEVKALLKGGPDHSISLNSYRLAAEWIQRTNPSHYRSELKVFINTHKKDETLLKSAAYADMVLAYYLSQSEDRDKILVDYLRSLMLHSNSSLQTYVLFRLRNLNPDFDSLETVLSHLTQR